MSGNLLDYVRVYAAEHKKRKKRYVIVTVLSVFVALITVYILSTPAHTLTDETYCGIEESPSHTHSLQCYSNPEADTEDKNLWEESVKSAEIGENTAENIIKTARTQLGYTESEKNYNVSEDGTVHGYTRYGAFCNSPYAEWDTPFCIFCLKYAGIDINRFAGVLTCDEFINAFECDNAINNREYIPSPGDVVFLGNTENKRVALVENVIYTDDIPTEISVIEGNYNNRVVLHTVTLNSGDILCYAVVNGNTQDTFELSKELEDGITVTVCGKASAFDVPIEELELKVERIEDKTADELIEDAVMNEEETSLMSVSKNLLFDIEIIRTDSLTGEKTKTEPVGDIELKISGISKTEETDTVEIYHVDKENAVAEKLDNLHEGTDFIGVMTDHFSLYGVSLLAASGSEISDLSRIKNSGTYYLTTDITVNNTVNISNNITSTLDLNGHKITANCNPLINLSNGAKLTITDNTSPTQTVTETSGTEYGKTASYENGVLTYYITETEVTDDSTGATKETQVKYEVTGAGMIVGQKNGRAFEVSGGAVLNLNGGYICNFKNDDGGAIKVSENNSTVNLTKTVIAANTSNKGGAIYLNGYSNLNISGGAITGNTATAEGGGGVYAVSYWQYATVNLTDGYITNNYASSNDYWNGGGGVQLERFSKLIITGGYITSNKAEGGGGGVKTRQDWSNNESGRIEMNGGFITANNGINAEGGGLNINAGGSMVMKSGYITNNRAGNGVNDSNFQHWGGGGLFCSENSSSIVIYNSLVTNNSAGGFGGGVAGCSTGRIVTSTESGTAIFDNDALGEHISGNESTKNEDHAYAAENEVFMSHGYQDYFCALSSSVSGQMLGGGAAKWEGSSDGIPVSSDSVNDVIIGSSVTGLTSNATDIDKSTAYTAARSFFNGNESPTHGGGILANGYLVLGDVDEFEVYARLEINDVKKKLCAETGEELEQMPGAFEFTVKDEYGTEVSHAVNTADGNVTFDRRLPFTSAGTFTYYLYEIPSSDSSVQHDTAQYKLVVTVACDSDVGNVPWTEISRVQYKFTNVKITETTADTVIYNANPGNDEAHSVEIRPLGNNSFVNYILSEQPEHGSSEPAVSLNVSVKKKWENSSTHPSSVNVKLMKDGEVADAKVLNSQNGWKYTWTNLQPGYEYTVVETPLEGYESSYSYNYTYDIETIETNQSNGVITYKLNNNGYYVPVSNSESLSTTGKYIISNSDGTKLLMITSAHANAPLTSADAYSATRDSQNRYKASDIPDNCVFTYYSTNNGNYSFKSLKNSGIWSFLLVQEVNGSFLKGTDGETWSSPAKLNNGHLQGQLCPDSWQSGNPWRYLIWDGSKFDTASELSKIKLQKVTASYKNYTVTNTPEDKVKYTLSVKKSEKGNALHILSGAVFEIKNGNKLLKFNEVSQNCYEYAVNGSVTELKTATNGMFTVINMPEGTYILSEKSPPTGYISSEDITFTLDTTTENRFFEITVENEKFIYKLPQTGGNGIFPFYLSGVGLMTCAVISLIIKRRKRKEVC